MGQSLKESQAFSTGSLKGGDGTGTNSGVRWGEAKVCLRREIFKAIVGSLGCLEESRTRALSQRRGGYLGKKRRWFPEADSTVCSGGSQDMEGSWVMGGAWGISMPVCGKLGVTQGEKLPLMPAGAGGFGEGTPLQQGALSPLLVSGRT